MTKLKLIAVLAVVVAIAVLVPAANADTITTSGGVSWTLTNAGSDGIGLDGGNVFDVMLTINTTASTVSSPLTVFSLQLGGTVTELDSVSSNAGTWTFEGQGNSSSGPACKTDSAGFYCTDSATGITVTSGGAGDGTYTFLYDVDTGVGGTAPTEGDIHAFQGVGGLALSNAVGIGPTPTPEPSTSMLLGFGLLGLVGLRRKQIFG